MDPLHPLRSSIEIFEKHFEAVQSARGTQRVNPLISTQGSSFISIN